MQKNNAKIVSLVPSWTETFIECGLNVVGRTRFCIHPALKVKEIPAVGGTKKLQIGEIVDLKPDFVILDKEENTLEMAAQLKQKNIQLVVSHVDSIRAAAAFLGECAGLFTNEKMQRLSEQYLSLAELKLNRELFLKNSITLKNAELKLENLDYVIWKNPYMLIGQKTFIADVFARVGLKFSQGFGTAEKYPQIDDDSLKKSYCLFSTEPYPFEQDFNKLTAEGFSGALIDGEKISWYGIRNFNFLKSCVE